jgi:hypothetical protein
VNHRPEDDEGGDDVVNDLKLARRNPVQQWWAKVSLRRFR